MGEVNYAPLIDDMVWSYSRIKAFEDCPYRWYLKYIKKFHGKDMLNYLDIYPLHLPARYNDRVACYTKVYLTSNLPLEKQYRAEQWDRPETWRAFLRRIHNVIEYLPDGSTVQHKKGGFPCDTK